MFRIVTGKLCCAERSGRILCPQLKEFSGAKKSSLIWETAAIINYNTGDTPLHRAVSRGAEMVKLLLDHGADPNLVNAQGDTPLVGVVSTAPEIIELLITHGADPWIANDRGDNAFDVFVGSPEIIEILNKAGTRTTAKK